MLQSKGYAVYANSKVQTASPAELTLMLYEAAIKFCNIAEMAIEKNDIHCFRKIAIQVCRDDIENIMICRGLCEQYTFFEMLII